VRLTEIEQHLDFMYEMLSGLDQKVVDGKVTKEEAHHLKQLAIEAFDVRVRVWDYPEDVRGKWHKGRTINPTYDTFSVLGPILSEKGGIELGPNGRGTGGLYYNSGFVVYWGDAEREPILLGA
jgi:hypothetical protein